MGSCLDGRDIISVPRTSWIATRSKSSILSNSSRCNTRRSPRARARATLKRRLAGHRVPNDSRRQPHARAALAGGIDATWRHVRDVFEQLRLGYPGVAHEADVDVTTDLEAVGQGTAHAAHELKQQRLLHVFVTWAEGSTRVRVEGRSATCSHTNRRFRERSTAPAGRKCQARPRPRRCVARVPRRSQTRRSSVCA